MEIVAEREVTVLREGPVTVRKSALDLGRDGVSGVKLEIGSTADHPVGIELHERVPGHLALADIQVHPQYWPGKWRKDAANHRLVFEHDLSPGGSIETIYGVRLTPDQLGPLLGDPELERVDVEGETEPDALDEAGRSVDEAAAPAEPEPDDPPADDVAASSEPEMEAPAADDSVAQPEPDASPDADEPQSGGEGPAPAEAADAGADRFRYGEDRPSSDEPTVENSSPEPQRAAGDDGAETRAQLEALQTAVGELTTYVETLGQRLEEAGAPSAAIEELQARQADQGETLAELAEGLDAETDRRAELADRLREAETERAALRDQLQGAEDRREELAERLRTESERRAELADRLRDGAAERAALRDQLQAAEDHRDELSARLRAEEDDRAALTERVANLEDQLLELRDRYEYQLESLDDRVDDLESAFSPEESRAIREVIAAERRWKRQHERRNRPARLASTGQRR